LFRRNLKYWPLSGYIKPTYPYYNELGWPPNNTLGPFQVIIAGISVSSHQPDDFYPLTGHLQLANGFNDGFEKMLNAFESIGENLPRN
jgi:hypothetical protein